MSRMLETLRKGDGQRPLAAPHLSAKALTDDCIPEWAVSDTQIPYIEVGAPGKVVEGSAEVLAVPHPAQPKQPPHRPTEQALVKSALLVQLTEARPLTVAFEPWTSPGAASTGLAPEIIAFHQPEHLVSKQYAGLWEKMFARLAGTKHVALLLSGLKPQVGATTVLVNLAVVAARQRRVAVVDAQPRHPSVAARVGFAPDLGLLDVIAGRAALEQVLVKTIVPSLHVLPLARRDDAVLTPEAAAWLLGWLRERFEVILIDGPSLDSPGSLAALAPVCDALFLVAPQGETMSLPRDALQSIARLGGKLRGILHTHFEG
jgi:Mrp family chromosome partitioning ATPase